MHPDFSSLVPPLSLAVDLRCVGPVMLACADKDLTRLDKKLARYQAQALAQNTTVTYRTAVMAFLRFCIFFGFTFLPPTDVTLARFVAFQSATCSFRSMKVYLFGIREWVLRMGHDFASWSMRYPVYRAMMGLKRIMGDAARQKMAVTPELLLAIYHVLDFSNENDVWLWAAMLVAFYGMFRKDNVTVGKASAFNPRANLCRGDLRWYRGQLWICVKHSKVIQFNQRKHWVPLLPVPNSPLCPLRAVQRAFRFAPHAERDSPAFMFVIGGRRGPMTHTMFVKAFKAACARAGVDATLYSGHSFRRGGATFAFRLGADHSLIKMIGDWRSDAYLLYEQTTNARRLALPKMMSDAAARISRLAIAR